MSIRRFVPRLVVAIAAASAVVPAAAQSAYTDPAAIDRAVAEFTGSSIGTPGGALRGVDRRLRLNACRGPLALAWYGTTRDNVRVECTDASGWKLFVPVRRDVAAMQAAAAPVVKRGENVSVVMRGRGFSITASGEAMEAGAEGEWIRVKPENAKEPVRARVERPGLVTIPMS
ncbi:flagellar basal body P-ring formation chaperone FlgA [Erythrobacter sp. LQ02-29]|uniref:flagellar basal body P-ring formation chaperone FlgA n=1 Tax=Erythrobacter sp. LQ02-29 TaxID=2920384 RepID=UPI001F4E6E20|nr:flagellar basal body P-ring formation chaperone FlgA [Erythrobacter sp. LQ02-29]MCP9221233.1 flagellar basal body P-ring formation chaperone FlgA [Erythrobacter sp. LQ02-29]